MSGFHGAADSHDQSLYALAVWLMLAPKMRDKEGMEALIRATDLDRVKSPLIVTP